MHNFEDTLKNIREVVDTYRSDIVLQDEDYKRLHRKLSSNLYDLNEHRVEYKKQWDAYYAQSKETSDAAKGRFADRMIPELYLCRKIDRAGESVLISINNQLKY